MRKAILPLASFLLLSSFQLNAQTIFTYGGSTVSKDEFLHAYEKNNANKKPDFSDTSLRSYINLYALYKMKVMQAEAEKLDTVPATRSEIENYKMQLARNYLTDKAVDDKLAKEAYERMKYDVSVAHILIPLRPGEDSAHAYHTIDSLYQAARSGQDFADLAKKYSQDKSTAADGGKVGYITILQTPYAFESAAYNTPTGQVSAPFRTQFGYHILKVLDKRPTRGKVEVQQILIEPSKANDAAADAEAMAKAQQVETELKNGASFESLVAKYSDDKYTKSNGGKMEAFGIGQMAPAFEDAAFALQQPGDVSAPVKTTYGYHIIKLVKKTPLEPFDKVESDIKRRIETDTRSTLAREAYRRQVEKQLAYKFYDNNYDALIQAIPEDSLNTKSFEGSKYANMTQPLFQLAGKTYTQYDFTKYVADITRGRIIGRKDKAFKDLFDMYKNKTINDIQMENLERTNTDFRSLLNEYHDGTLIFALMEKKVWNRAQSDTTGLKKFYEQHASKYKWQPGFEGAVYQSADAANLQKFRDEVNNGMMVQDALDKINTEANPTAIVSQMDGRYEFTSFPQLQASDFVQERVTPVANDNKPGTDFAIYVRKVYAEAEPKTLDEARGVVTSDYQDYLEQQWENELKAQYPLKINEKVLRSIENKK